MKRKGLLSLVVYGASFLGSVAAAVWSLEAEGLRGPGRERVSLPARVRVLTGHGSWVSALAFSPDGRTLASGTGNCHIPTAEVKLWDVATGRERAAVTGHAGSVEAMKFSPDGRQLAAAGSAGTVRLWDAGDGRPCALLPGKALDLVRGLAFSPHGRLLYSASLMSDSVIAWEMVGGLPVAQMPGGGRLALSPDGGTLAVLGGPAVTLWDAFHCRKQLAIPVPPCAADLAFSPDGRSLAVAGLDGFLNVWDAATGDRRASLPGHEDVVNAVAFSPDGRTLASAGHDRVVRLWDVESWQERSALTGHTGAVTALAFSPDGRLLATGGYDRTVRLWELGAAD